MVLPNLIPQDLKACAHWVLWRYELREGKWTKPPHQMNGSLADSTSPSTWTTFDAALAAYEAGDFDGLGFVLTSDLDMVGFDLDHAVNEDGTLQGWARQIVEEGASYTEISPSGTGLHIFMYGTLPPKDRKIGAFECYSEGRYLTLTGNHLPGTPAAIEHRQDAIDSVHTRMFAPRNQKRGSGQPVPAQPVSVDDQELLAKAFSAPNGAALQRLYEGDYSGYPSHSEGDLALASRLGFWAGGEFDRVDRLFRASDMFRPKWDERRGPDTYGTLTIRKALEGVTEFYSPAQAPSRNGHKGVSEGGPARFSRTDSGNAELFASLYGSRVRYDHLRGRWLVWAGHWWRSDTDAEIHRMAKDAARHRYAVAASLEDLAERQAEAKWAIGTESRSRLDAALALAQAERPIADAGDEWDADPWLLGVTNGVVNLQTGQLRAGRPEDRITMRVPVQYDPGAQAQRWLRFLEEVFGGDAELVDYLHRGIGYSITGDVQEQCLWVLYGRGANGKSVFLTVLRALAGEYAYNVPFSTFEALSRPSIPNDLAALAGKRLVTASETSERTRLNEARLKALTGGDPVTARFLHQEFFSFQPNCKLWLAVNHRPRVDDDSLGFWRRVRLVPFERTFQGKDADPRLTQALLAELPGILAWAIQGCQSWQERGLEPPERVVAATEEYRAESDPLAAFIVDRGIVRPEASALSGDLFRAYQDWAASEGIPPPDRLTSRAFGRRLGERFDGKRSNRGRVYQGVGLLQDHGGE